MTLGRRYELRAPLGTGSMAQVVEAHDVVLDRDVAIKLLRTESADAEGIARFVREARVAASLSHRTSCASSTPARRGAGSTSSWSSSAARTSRTCSSGSGR